MNKQECLHPNKEIGHHENWEDLEEDLKEGSKEDYKEDDSHPDEKEDEDGNSFAFNTEVSNTSNNHSINNGNANSNHRNSTTTTTNHSTWIQPNDPFPLPGHLGHNWGRCFQNAHNTSTRSSNHSPERDAHLNERSRKPVRSPP